jgi:hypothetical protein
MSFARRALVGLPILGAFALGVPALVRRLAGRPAPRTWPSRAEFEQMDDAAMNEYLASRGFEVRVKVRDSASEPK